MSFLGKMMKELPFVIFSTISALSLSYAVTTKGDPEFWIFLGIFTGLNAIKVALKDALTR